MKKSKYLWIVSILFLSIGYATITSTLGIDSFVGIGSNQEDFEIYFSNAKENGTINRKLIKNDTHISLIPEIKNAGETYILEYDVTNGSRNYDAEVKINCTESNEYLKITNVFDTITNLPATETRTGKLTIEVIKSLYSDKKNKL